MKTKPFNLEEAIEHPELVVFASTPHRPICVAAIAVQQTRHQGKFIYLIFANGTLAKFSYSDSQKELALIDDAVNEATSNDPTPILKDFNDLPTVVWVRLFEPEEIHEYPVYLVIKRTTERIYCSHGVEAVFFCINCPTKWQWSSDLKTWHNFKFA